MPKRTRKPSQDLNQFGASIAAQVAQATEAPVPGVDLNNRETVLRFRRGNVERQADPGATEEERAAGGAGAVGNEAEGRVNAPRSAFLDRRKPSEIRPFDERSDLLPLSEYSLRRASLCCTPRFWTGTDMFQVWTRYHHPGPERRIP
jgi:hypothetical protein